MPVFLEHVRKCSLHKMVTGPIKGESSFLVSRLSTHYEATDSTSGSTCIIDLRILTADSSLEAEFWRILVRIIWTAEVPTVEWEERFAREPSL